MFSRNGRYVVNQFEEDIFDQQLPSTSIKIPFKKARQKILNISQRKYELQILRQQIHQRCRADQIQYLDMLQQQKRKFLKFQEEQQNRKQQYLLNIIQKKYDLSGKSNNQIRDSIDDVKNQNKLNNQAVNKPKKSLAKYSFALEQTKQKQKEQIQQNQWIVRVMQGRKKLQQKLGKYHSTESVNPSSDSESDTDSESSKTSKENYHSVSKTERSSKTNYKNKK